MRTTDISIGKNLRKVRIYNGLSQQELADALGTTKAAVSAYEHSKTRPTFAMLIKIAQVLNVSTDYLLSFGDEYLDEVYDVSPINLIWQGISTLQPRGCLVLRRDGSWMPAPCQMIRLI